MKRLLGAQRHAHHAISPAHRAQLCALVAASNPTAVARQLRLHDETVRDAASGATFRRHVAERIAQRLDELAGPAR